MKNPSSSVYLCLDTTSVESLEKVQHFINVLKDNQLEDKVFGGY